MDYFQSVVGEYLRADRHCFINPEFWMRGNRSKPMNAPHWYVDVLAVHMAHQCVYLCEVTYAKKAVALIKRLQSWQEHWETIVDLLREDTLLPIDWKIKPWIFAPKSVLEPIIPTVRALHPFARFTNLEDTMPWLYCTWDKKDNEPPQVINIPA